jgi:hypothetical protein
MTRRFFKLGGLIVLATGCSAMTSPDKSQSSVPVPGGAAGAAAGAGHANGGSSGGSSTAGSGTSGAGVGGSKAGAGGG